jgi:hypothetical protein
VPFSAQYVPNRERDAYFDSIDSKLSTYEAKLSAYKGLTILELAIWKSEIAAQTDGNINLLTPDMKMGCRTESQWRVDFIVSGVLSFLYPFLEVADGGFLVGLFDDGL